MESLDPQLQQLLEKYKAHFSLQDNGKILCNVNGHTLPPRYDEVSKFIQGPKFQKLLKRHQAEDALKKYEPFIVQSKNFPLMLYCALTGQLMDKSVEAVKKHMQGKKFQRAKERFTNDEIDLKPEPSLESFGVKVPKVERSAEGDAAEQQLQPRKKQKQQGDKAANGTAVQEQQQNGGEDADDSDEPAFWQPSDDTESIGGEEGESEGRLGSDVDMDAEQAEAGASEDPMDEDTEQQQQHKSKAATEQTKVAATSAAAAAFSAGSSKQKQRHKSGAETGKKKQNTNRPSSSKKAKR